MKQDDENEERSTRSLEFSTWALLIAVLFFACAEFMNKEDGIKQIPTPTVQLIQNTVDSEK